MPEPGLSSQGKRARSEQHSDQQNEASPPIKRRKANRSSGPSAAFWDHLSKIWLTKGALRELDRRNTQAAPSAYRPVHEQLKTTSEWERFEALLNHDPSTFKDVKSFARHGGPDLSDLRSFAEPTHITKHTMSASRSSTRSRQRDSASTRPTTNTTRTKSTGVYDRDFQQHLVDHNVYPHGYRHSNGSVPTKPTNWRDINEILAQPRPSLSPSKFGEEDYERFVQADADASKEKQVSELVIPLLEGRIEDAKCRSGGIPFTNLEPLTDGTLKPGNPDIYYGARPEQLSKEVRTELGSYIIPSTQHDLPMVPNFFLAAKGPDGSLAVAGRQACYDGALGARGMASLESYGQGEQDYGSAYAISSIYHGGQLKMYTSHIAQPSSPGGRPEYYMNQLRSFAMTDTVDTFRQGAGAYRNLRDWAKEQRDDLIRQANERAALADVETPTNDNDAGTSPALSFVTAASETEAYTMSQESRTTLNEGSNILGIFEESDSSIVTLADTRVAAKQSNKRKRRSTNTGSEAELRAD
ncbi:hypothetical protein BU23DRAFT_473853 [Bimuria novae-zelandiae CBS 107.79]|uniref:DUF7924 domain-containing protein n=1 Tax=Bimuria novae-zelandiae CBS 107.79 TaxID=1447943 RepID=A0A6A5V0P9_9PLEO|nr:hypothetical protein BU23DRAFT_473853 [Bimuria novae-zelandiae CBS 107.79]